MGDPRYGRNNKNTSGLKLWAVELAFRCPFSGQQLCFEWQPSLEEQTLAGQNDGQDN